METADGGRDERHNVGEKLSGKERFLKDKKDKRHKQGKEGKERTVEGLQAR